MSKDHPPQHDAVRDGSPVAPRKTSGPSWWKRIFCAVIGHDPVMRHGRTRCARCGVSIHVERTPGWRGR